MCSIRSTTGSIRLFGRLLSVRSGVSADFALVNSWQFLAFCTNNSNTPPLKIARMGTILREGLVLGLGNPLLDISAATGVDFLNKYGLKPNDAILADERHKDLYEDLVENYQTEYVAGGASQNTMRIAQSILKKPNVCSYMGCIGTDKYGKILEEIARDAGVNGYYMYDDNTPTGTCAVIITGFHRSLCANLSAANCFKIDHLRKPENRKVLEKAEFYYLTGFFLTVCPEAMLEVAKHSYQFSKTMFLNLSAPFLIEFFDKPMMKIMPYVDVLIGNETEALTFARHHNFQVEDIEEVALKLSSLPKKNSIPRIVVVTQGLDPVIVAQDGRINVYPTNVVPREMIKDTNGAGDAFAGGFIAMFCQGKDIDVCIKCAMYAASQIIQQSGCTAPENMHFDAEDL